MGKQRGVVGAIGEERFELIGEKGRKEDGELLWWQDVVVWCEGEGRRRLWPGGFCEFVTQFRFNNRERVTLNVQIVLVRSKKRLQECIFGEIVVQIYLFLK